jgi:hypothetical protein
MEPAGLEEAKRYRKKPVIISARLWTGPGVLTILTLEGEMTASPGDYIITGVAGEKYPCKPQIFLATYEPVDEAMS